MACKISSRTQDSDGVSSDKDCRDCGSRFFLIEEIILTPFLTWEMAEP